MTLSSRSFDAPLFGNNSSTTFNVFGRQMLSGGLELSGYAYGGFPNATTYLGLRLDRVRFGGGYATFDVGDFTAVRVQPQGVITTPESFALMGAQLRWVDGDHRGGSLYVGRSKFLIALPGTEEKRPGLAGGEYFFRHNRDWFGVGLTAVDQPVYADPTIQRDRDGIVRLSYSRRVSPLVFVSTDALVGHGSGIRAGATFESETAFGEASVYAFSRELPMVSNFNPGESGLHMSGSYRASELSRFSAQAYYVTSDTSGRRDVRGDVSFLRSFGADAPYIFVDYAREQLSVDTADRNVSHLADVVTVAATKSSANDYSVIQLERTINRDNDKPDTTQLLATTRRIFGSSSILDGSLVLQTEESRWGSTLEAAIETPWRGPYYILGGLGAAYLTNGTASGEGVLRAGLARRPLGNGLYGHAEIRLPVSIGLPRSNLNRNYFLIDVGSRFGWEDLRGIHSMLTPILTPSQFGSVEGRVLLDGTGAKNIVILFNGEPAAETNADGSFRIGRVRAGAAKIGIDETKLDLGLSVVGESEQPVLVQPKSATRVEFRLAHYTTLRGSFVHCENDRPKPIAGARFVLTRGETKISVATNSSGSFQVNEVPPGEYEVVVDPSSVPSLAAADLPHVRVDLRQDVLGFVLGVRCPTSMTARGRAAIVQPATSAEPPPIHAESEVAELQRKLRQASFAAVVDPQAARPAFEEIARSSAADAVTVARAARSLVALHDFGAAAAAFDRARLLGMTDEDVGFDYVVALYESGRVSEARTQLDRILPFIESNPAVDFYRTKIHSRN